MGPVPEPVPSTNLSDEELPPQPPIVISSDEDDDDILDESQLNDFPPGYIPIQQHIDFQWQSDSDDNDNTEESSNNTLASQGCSAEASTPSNSEPGDSSDAVIDYSSVSSLMQAYNTHGATVIENSCGLDSAFSEEDRNRLAAQFTVATQRSNDNLDEALKRLKIRANKTCQQEESSGSELVQGSEFNSKPLGEEQETAVKQAMMAISLPPSAIPHWAHNVKDDDLTAIVKQKLQTKKS